MCLFVFIRGSFFNFFVERQKNICLSINRRGVAYLIENSAKNEGSDYVPKSLSPCAACIKNFFIFFRFFQWGVAFLVEKYAENEGREKSSK